MRSRNTTLVAVLIISCALVAAACGGSSSKGSSKNPTPTSAAPFKDSRFTGNTTFCKPPTGPPAEAPKTIDKGLTSDSVVITHVRLDTSLIAALGFAFDYGNAVDQVNTFVKVINDQCGGINGRKLVVHDILQPVPGLSGDAQLEAQKSCTKIYKDWDSVVAFSFTGIGDPLAQCVTGPNPVDFIGTYDFSQQDFDQSQGRLISFNHAPTSILKYAALELAPKLKGKKVWVVTDDTTPNPQVVQDGLMKTLKDLGIDAQLDVMRCGDDPTCSAGVVPSVQRMVASKSTAVFPLLSTLTLPGYLNEMATEGIKPGDVQFYNTSFQAQDSELVASHIPTAGSKKAAALYDGATIVSQGREGDWRLPGYKPDPFNQMCNTLYVKNSTYLHKEYNPLDDDQTRKFADVGAACAMVRLIAWSLEAAGPNPSRTDITKAMDSLGKVDTGQGSPASLLPGKPAAPDVIAIGNYRYPCPSKTSGETNDVCMVPQTGLLPLPKS